MWIWASLWFSVRAKPIVPQGQVSKTPLENFGVRDGFHTTSKPDAIQGEVVVVEVQKHLGIFEHLLCSWTLLLGKLDHLVLAFLILQDLTHGVRFEGCALFHHLLHS